MRNKVLFALPFLFAATCLNPSSFNNNNQIKRIAFNGYYKYETVVTYSDSSLIDTIVTIQRLLSDSLDPFNNEIFTIQDSINNVVNQSRYLQNKYGIFLIKYDPGNQPLLSKKSRLEYLYNSFPVIIYGLKQNADSNYFFKNNTNDSVQGSQIFLGNQLVSVNNNRYDCSVIKNSSDSAAFVRTIYYSEIGLIKKTENFTQLKMVIDSLGQLVQNGTVTISYVTEIFETR